MTDVVVTVPKGEWSFWLRESDLPGDVETGDLHEFSTGGHHPSIVKGERVYVVAHGRLRGYAPLTYLQCRGRSVIFFRQGGAVALTVDEQIRGFQGWRYRWWKRTDEQIFPDWKTEGVV